MTYRRSPIALLAVLALALALGLAACGGGGSSSTGESSSTAASDSLTSPAAPPAFLEHVEASAKIAAERRKAGRAASFVEPGGDNSIPTFGSEAPAAERRAAEANLRAYLSARAAQNWTKACAYLASSVKEGYERLASSSAKSGPKPTCARILPVFAQPAAGVPANPLSGHLAALRTQGATGFAFFYGPPGRQAYLIQMSREAGEWRPAAAAPGTYP